MAISRIFLEKRISINPTLTIIYYTEINIETVVNEKTQI